MADGTVNSSDWMTSSSAGMTSSPEGMKPSQPLENFSSSMAERVGVISMLVVFQVFGIAGNTLVLIVFGKRLRVPHSRNVHNYMIFALALGDITTLVISGTSIEVAQYIVDQSSCRASQFFNVLTVFYVHLLVAFAIPVERYFAICRPHSKFGKREAAVLVSTSFILSTPLASLYSAYTSVYSVSGELVGCHFSYTTFFGKVVIPLVSFIMFALALIFSVALYTVIYVRITQLRRNNTSRRSIDDLVMKTRIVSMLFGVTVIYFSAWLPYFLVAFRAVPYDNRLKAFFLFNNSTNFIIYALLNATIRKEMITVLRCGHHIKGDNSSAAADSRTFSTPSDSKEKETPFR